MPSRLVVPLLLLAGCSSPPPDAPSRGELARREAAPGQPASATAPTSAPAASTSAPSATATASAAPPAPPMLDVLPTIPKRTKWPCTTVGMIVPKAPQSMRCVGGWCPMKTDIPPAHVHELWSWASGPLSAEEPLFVGTYRGIRTFDGKDWDTTNFEVPAAGVAIYGIAGHAQDKALVVGMWGFAYQRSGSGAKAIAPISDHNLYAIWQTADGARTYVGGDDGFFRVDGQTVTKLSSRSVCQLVGEREDDLWAVPCGAGALVHFDGKAWTHVETPESRRLGGIWRSPDGTLFASGGCGTGMQLKDGAWTLGPALARWSLGGIHGTSSRDVYAVGAHGLVVHFDGKQWRRQRTPGNVELGPVWVGKHDVFAGGVDGHLWRKKR